jgi:glycosyltransferase involved in cell wall biosynthesis
VRPTPPTGVNVEGRNVNECAAVATPRETSHDTTGSARIAAVIPALNEAPSIGRVVRGLRTQTTTALLQIIVADNGSSDDTATIARTASATVVTEPRRGYGYACRAGVLAADADVIVLLDGDAADDPADLPHVLAPILDGSADLVVGSRSLGTLEPGSMTPHQVFGNWLAATIMRHLYGVAVSDLGPFRAIRRADLLALDMQEMTYGWSVEMMVKAARAGLRYHEVPVSYRRRAGGVSKVAGTLSGSVRAGWCILSTTVRYCRWTAARPLTRAAATAVAR